MARKPNSKTIKNGKPLNVSPQMWALSPMVSMVGMAGCAEIAKEGVEFISERIKKDMQAQRDILNCKSLQDVLRVQSEYFQDAAEQYTGQLQRVAELLSETMALGLSEATVSRAREYDDIPL